MCKARITLAACITAVTAASAAASIAGSVAPGSSARPAAHSSAAAAAEAQVTVSPGAIRIPAAPTPGPLTMAQCEKLDGIACFTPAQLRAAYRLPALYAKGVTGKGVTILIVDSFGSPTIEADLAKFDRQFGYPAPPKFTVIAPVGKIPPFDPNNADMTGWAGETT